MRVTKELAAKVKTSVYAKFTKQFEECAEEKNNVKAQYLINRRNARSRMVDELMAAQFSDKTTEMLLSVLRENAATAAF